MRQANAARGVQEPHFSFLYATESSIVAMLPKQHTAMLDSQIQ